MKKYINNAAVIFLAMLIMLPSFTSVAHAKTSFSFLGIRFTGFLPVVLAIVLVVLITVLKKKGSIGSRSDDSSFLDKGTFSSNPDPTLTPEENQLLMMYKAEIKAKKPDPVSTTCPNCGAPLRISDIAECPYCRTELTNSNVDPKFIYDKKKPIPPENYNPRRYYDEHNTGYENISSNNQPDINSYYGEDKSGFSPYSDGSGYSSSGSSNSSYGNNSYSNSGYGNNSYGNNSYGNNSYGNNGYGNNGYGNNGYSNNSYGNNGYGNSSYGNNGYGSNSFDSQNNSSYGDTGGAAHGSGFATGDGFNDSNQNW